jgi:hypothetical protein
MTVLAVTQPEGDAHAGDPIGATARRPPDNLAQVTVTCHEWALTVADSWQRQQMTRSRDRFSPSLEESADEPEPR